jgi:UDP-glucose 4-epimerase
MRNVLVTGGAGFIGSHLVEGLVQRGDHVRVVDDFSTGKERNLSPIRSQIELVKGDLSDPAVCAAAVVGIDVIFHEAALPSVQLSVERPLDTHAKCATTTLALLDQARRAGVRRLVYAASSSAYGDYPTAAKRETDPLMTMSPYAAAKLAGEFYCQAFFQSFGFETVCLRYFNVFGPRQDPASPYSAVIPLFITAMLERRQPTIYGDGQQSRDFVYVGNIVDANLLAAERPGIGGRVFNIGIGRSYSLLELLSALNQVLGCNFQARFQPPRVGDVRESLADITLSRSVLGYEPRVQFLEGLQKTVEFYKSANGPNGAKHASQG